MSMCTLYVYVGMHTYVYIYVCIYIQSTYSFTSVCVSPYAPHCYVTKQDASTRLWLTPGGRPGRMMGAIGAVGLGEVKAARSTDLAIECACTRATTDIYIYI